MAVRAMKAGAVDFLTKPFRSQDLLDAVFTALGTGYRTRRTKQQLHSTLRKNFELLNAREREVIARVTVGDLNKQIAAELGLSEVTVKVHRAPCHAKNGRKVIGRAGENDGAPQQLKAAKQPSLRRSIQSVVAGICANLAISVAGSCPVRRTKSA